MWRFARGRASGVGLAFIPSRMGGDRRIDELRAIMRQLDDAMREAESLRAHLDHTRPREPFWPDRRVPKRWERATVAAADSPHAQEAISGKGEPELVDE